MIYIIILAVLAAVGIFVFKVKNQGLLLPTSNHQTLQHDGSIRPSYIMTNHEKTMFAELLQAVPECYIFPQVSFGAILWTKNQSTRNKFNRKIADFVVVDNRFNILAVIELDDKSHDNKQQQDAERDAMLRQAGYQVLRYRHMPDKAKLRSDILGGFTI